MFPSYVDGEGYKGTLTEYVASGELEVARDTLINDTEEFPDTLEENGITLVKKGTVGKKKVGDKIVQGDRKYINDPTIIGELVVGFDQDFVYNIEEKEWEALSMSTQRGRYKYEDAEGYEGYIDSMQSAASMPILTQLLAHKDVESYVTDAGNSEI